MRLTESSTAALKAHPYLTGAAAGLIAGAVTGQTDKVLDRFVSPRQKRRDRPGARGTRRTRWPGPISPARSPAERLSEKGKKRARAAFGVVYGLGWGLIYAGLRKKFPRLSRLAGLPFAIPFFFACDGTLAPLLGVSPSLRRIPWQPSAKEMGNHIAWTAAAELVHRAVERAAR